MTKSEIRRPKPDLIKEPAILRTWAFFRLSVYRVWNFEKVLRLRRTLEGCLKSAGARDVPARSSIQATPTLLISLSTLPSAGCGPERPALRAFAKGST